jgi:hypothetical protein
MTNYVTPYELKDDRGNLFQNKKKKVGEAAEALVGQAKEDNEKKPHMSGKLKLNGQEFWLSAWEKRTKSGDLFYDVKLGGMVPAQPTQFSYPSQHSIDKGNGYMPNDKKDNMDDEIPF